MTIYVKSMELFIGVCIFKWFTDKGHEAENLQK